MDNSSSMVSFSLIQSAWAGTIIYPTGGRYGPRIQDDMQLVLLHSGEMEIEIDGKAHVITPGSVVLLKPEHHEQFAFSKRGETWHRWISIHMNPLSEMERAYYEELPLVLPISEELNRLTDVMLSLQNDHSSDSEVLRSLGMSAILLYISEITRKRELEEVHSSILMAKSLIHSTYHEQLTLTKLADYGGVSPEHLVRLFRLHENITPIKYLWQYRVLRSLELLTHTGLTITEISLRCGFKSTFHFARMVKQQTGKTPSEIRAFSWKGH
ncbi:AraC family transcriptional regulator of arabinose operon [Paenibacillus castaneae]|uniref:helix-turn-helix transcriptional regulator n=1 Tax=Paenibacillus castaneae TaxID=474957 RepID=UPI000C9BF71D|nr:AraC family transcriptional regulator [Paenibacillus castaneae]NIK76327.1 AraC family transcriptional regulator of arabinose operon [Paenibacillus castaneae]